MSDTPLPSSPQNDPLHEQPLSALESSGSLPSVTPSEPSSSTTQAPSMLEAILQSSKQEEALPPVLPPPGPVDSLPPGATPPKVKKPMDAIMFFRLISALLLTILIFFGSFLAYIVFNPDKARFFLIFNIELADVQSLLAGLVNGIFGFVVVLLAIVWVILLFRAIWTPSVMKKKKTLSILGAIFVGALMFSLIGIWALLITRINATDYGNLEGSVKLYDNDLRKIAIFQKESEVGDMQSIFGPITILFDISANARRVASAKMVTIDRYNIDFDGAKCTTGNSRVAGTDPNDTTIICTFDEVREYQPKGTYEGIDRATGEKVSLDIELPQMKVVGLVVKSSGKNIVGKPIYTLDASSLRSFGTPNWILSDGKNKNDPFNGGTRKKSASITEVVEKEQKSFCLTFEGATGCRIFVIDDSIQNDKNGTITVIQDPINPLHYTFTLTGITTNVNEITDIIWRVNDGADICIRENNLVCDTTFSNYVRYEVSVVIQHVGGKTEEFRTVIAPEAKINLAKRLKVVAPDGTLLNTNGTLDITTNTYIIRNLKVPTRIEVDARDVLPTEPGFTLDHVLWTVVQGKNIDQYKGEKTFIDITQEGRYEITGEYTFFKKDGTLSGQMKTGGDRIILDISREKIRPILEIANHSDYAPVTITFDASPSESQYGKITKFIFDFGEGKPPVEGDAVQNYYYATPGAKDIKLTVITEYGDTATITKTVILKEIQKKVVLSPSIDRAQVGGTVDWSSNGTIGQISETIWNFGDGTAVSRDPNPTHTYAIPGTFTTTLTVRFADGTEQRETRSFTVVD